MNIQMQICGLIIMCLLMYFYRHQKTVGLNTEKIFLRVLSTAIFCVLFDILSLVAIAYRDMIPKFLLDCVCKTYIVSLVWVGFSGLAYTMTDLYTKAGYRRTLRSFFACTVAATLLIYCFPIYYHIEGDIIFTYGPSVAMTYICAVLLVLITFFKVIHDGKRMNPKRRRAVAVWMIIWLLAAGFQFLNNRILLVGFATSVGMLILFFELENPEANLDRETGAFNSHVLLEYMKQLYAGGKRFSLLVISLERFRGSRVEVSRLKDITGFLLRYFETIPDVKVFKNVESEFVLLFENSSNMEQAFYKLQKQFARGFQTDDEEKPVLFSEDPLYIQIPDSTVAEGAEEMFRLFNYYKMQIGSLSENGVLTIEPELSQQRRECAEMQNIILSALEEDRVEVFYQPIYSTEKKSFVSAEALCRIRDRDGSVIPPGRFISVAEETGLILRLGEVVFEKTCRFIKENDPGRYGIEYIEVNLSVLQCEHRELAEIYMGIMDKYKIDPAFVNLEITESASLQAKKTLLENMHILIDYGVTFSLDDFGSGQSNLNYIVDMPVQIVKFDRDMMQSYFENRRAKFVLEAAMHMIHGMGLKIVSEGIETKEQMEAVVGLGIDFIQGYYFAKPMQEDAFLKLLR